MPVSVATSEIVDQAVRAMELDPISSFGDDSDLAVDVAKAYPTALNFCFELEDWAFASVLCTLPPTVTPPTTPFGTPYPGVNAEPDPGLPYKYTLPGDCVRLREVYDNVSWRLDGRFLRADQDGGVMVRYTARIEYEQKLSPSFINLVSLRLALMLAPKWLQTGAKRKDLFALYDRAIVDARSADRTVSSGRRWDGGEAQADWVSEALR